MRDQFLIDLSSAGYTYSVIYNYYDILSYAVASARQANAGVLPSSDDWLYSLKNLTQNHAKVF